MFLFLALLVWGRALNIGPFYDDSFNASVSKNLARGWGYVSSYDEVAPFDPSVSTGPALLAPFALFLMAAGNAWWAPGVFSALCNTVLVAAIGVCGRRMLGLARGSAFVILFLCMILTFMPGDGWFALWYQLLGEVPGSLLVILAALLGFEGSRRDWLRAVLAGLMFGLAMMTKTILVFGFAGFLLARVLPGLSSQYRLARRAGLAVASLLGFAVPWVIFEAAKRLSLGPAGYGFLKTREIEFFAVGGSGLAQLVASKNILALLRQNASGNFAAFSDLLRGAWPALGLAAVAVLALILGLRNRRAAPGVALLLGASIHFAWWLLISSNRDLRHVMPAALYFAAGMGIVIAAADSKVAAIAVAAALAVVCSPKLSQTAAPELWPSTQPRVLALNATADYLRRARFDGPLVGYGWWANRDLEYVLPGVLNFRDYAKLPPESRRRAVLVRSDFWNWEHDPEMDRLSAACNQRVLFQKEPFTVCSLDALDEQAP